VGIPDLLVVIYDADPGTSGEDAQPGAADPSGLGDRLGSRLTDGAGAFEFEYEEDEFRVRNPKEARPDLLLSVVAPEEQGATPESRVLFTSLDLRWNAGRTEQYLIRISGDALQKAGIAVPLDPTVAREETQVAVGKMQQAVDQRMTLEQQTRNVLAQQVDVARTSSQTVDPVVGGRLMASVTGVTAEEAQQLNIVPPGVKPQEVTWKSANTGIEKVNASSIAGYVVLSETEAEQFRDAQGNYREHIPAQEIEPFIFGAGTADSRPGSILRSDPVAAMCRQGNDPGVVTPDPPTLTTDSPPAGPPTGPPPDEPVGTEDLPKLIGRLVNPMVAPEDNPVFGQRPRPTSTDVQASVEALQLGGGPADVTAYYDFHGLQIAFDYVWQQAIDSGILETGTALARALIDQGSDPVAALQGGADPVAALRSEARHVATAQQSLQAAGPAYQQVAARPAGTEGGGAGTVTGPVRPNIVRPPFASQPPVDTSPEPGDLLAELEEMLSERYAFEVFAPGSSNFGLLVTYRQRWDPITYQVGNLVKTLTLAPKETRKIVSKRTVKRSRSVKELQDNQRNRKDETSQTMRDEAEIVQRAQNKTNFTLSAKGSYDIGISDGDASSSLTRDADISSQETKKSFHEAVMKAAQEFKDERKLEVETTESVEDEVTDTSEITNPNDELTVTYLLYELQRRFRVSEQLHELTPVVFVAMDVPNPNRDAIDQVLLAHSWIINRVLLDDRYRPPLDYLCTRVVGDELALQDLVANVAAARQAVDDLTQMHKNIELTLAAREAALQSAIEARAGAVAHNDSKGLGEEAWDTVFGSGDGNDVEAARILEEGQQTAYERAVSEEKDLRMRLESETASLSAATEEMAKARAEHSNRLLQIAGLRAHFKENVLFYMQAIWSFTFRDQIFFSLCNITVPKLTAAQSTYTLKVPTELPLSISPKPGQIVLEVDADVQLAGNLDPQQDFVTLAEVADLDSPLGYKGNYMIFPLKQSNALTDFMMMPYVDTELGIHDPDDLGSWTPEDFADYARCLQARFKDELSPSDYAALQSQLEAQYTRIISNPQLNNDVVIVPTSSLYMEALPGTHPLLENFKLDHRAIDVQKAQADVRKEELENLRYAARILSAQLADPDIDKKIVVEGDAGVVVPAGD
jgi:hypothetical protein